MSKKKHPFIEGIYEVIYQIPKKGPTGEIADPISYKVMRDPKNLYDPNVISDELIFQWGSEAIQQGVIQPDGRSVIGKAPNGLRFKGYLDTNGNVTNFFPMLD